MKRKIDFFKVGIYWAIACSILMLVGAVIYNKFPPIFELYDNNIFWLIAASLIYIAANFIIFTFPAFLVYKSGELSNKLKKNSIKRTVFLLKKVLPITFFFCLFYLIAAGIRGDIFTNSLAELTDYGYCIGVIVTAMLFGFRDLNDVEVTQQKHENELVEMKKSLSEYEAKYKKMKNRYTDMRNKGKRELAKLEKKYQLEDSQYEDLIKK